MKLIVVGVDGSPSSGEALSWAVAEARRTGATVEAIHAWDPAPIIAVGLPEHDLPSIRKAAEERASSIVRRLAQGERDVRIVPRMVLGGAAQALVDAAADADLLVVGSRGLGGLKGMLLGSVGHHCVAHAKCPVVIVHHAPPPRHKPPQRETLGHERIPPALHPH